jgi:hypothetical protein
MKTFVIIALVSTLLFAFATYHPTRVCEHVRTTTRITYHNGGGTATTDQPDLFCHDDHL